MEEEVGQIRRKMNAGVATTAKKLRERDREREGGGKRISLLESKSEEQGRSSAGNEACQAQSPVREGLSILFFVMCPQ